MLAACPRRSARRAWLGLRSAWDALAFCEGDGGGGDQGHGSRARDGGTPLGYASVLQLGPPVGGWARTRGVPGPGGSDGTGRAECRESGARPCQFAPPSIPIAALAHKTEFRSPMREFTFRHTVDHTDIRTPRPVPDISGHAERSADGNV